MLDNVQFYGCEINVIYWKYAVENFQGKLFILGWSCFKPLNLQEGFFFTQEGALGLLSSESNFQWDLNKSKSLAREFCSPSFQVILHGTYIWLPITWLSYRPDKLSFRPEGKTSLLWGRGRLYRFQVTGSQM